MWILEENEFIRRRLGKLGEEMGELQQIKERILLQGMEENNPSTARKLIFELEDEIADVYAQLDETVEGFDLNKEVIEGRRNQKRKLMQDWESHLKKPT